ncbi:uncharacterized protein PITG_02795 [Phytophthora infestans T30-4]|uniref:Uncharacterized protein n=1 Tax=Phytophthora infestans (strain T30-4) TaxID=403677 RepID=D0MX88_PHYIT|nr:uncharacterized protein PITG_02795 [Phytophthora infestans T30-4]EEY64251.1 conserved hypothetical protein [Phytophthora infestans T30-4]|eukprot:XP_002907687.1 conserved hypothetical protein [Phytophthora infestans T30-4]
MWEAVESATWCTGGQMAIWTPPPQKTALAKRKEAFMPHVSFIYGDLANKLRANLAKELQPSLDSRRLKMKKLQVWRTLGPAETWELVAEQSLIS